MRLLYIVYLVYLFISSLLINNLNILDEIKNDLEGVYFTPLVYSEDQSPEDSIEFIVDTSLDNEIQTSTYVMVDDTYYIYTTDMDLDENTVQDALNITNDVVINNFTEIYNDFELGSTVYLFYYGNEDNYQNYISTLREQYRAEGPFDFAHVYSYNSSINFANKLYYMFDIILIFIMIVLYYITNVKNKREILITSFYKKKNYKRNLIYIPLILVGFINLWYLIFIIPVLILKLIDIFLNYRNNYIKILKKENNSFINNVISISCIYLLKIVQVLAIIFILYLIPSLITNLKAQDIMSNVDDYALLELTYLETKNIDSELQLQRRADAENYFIENHDAFYNYKYDPACYDTKICDNDFNNYGVLANQKFLELQNIDLGLDEDENYILIPQNSSYNLDDMYESLEISPELEIEQIYYDDTIFSFDVNDPYYNDALFLITNNTSISYDIALRSISYMNYYNPADDDSIIKQFYDSRNLEYTGVLPNRNLNATMNAIIYNNISLLKPSIIILILLSITTIMITNLFVILYVKMHSKLLAIHFLTTGKDNKILIRLFLMIHFIDFIGIISIIAFSLYFNILSIGIIITLLMIIINIINVSYLNRVVKKDIIKNLKGYND